MSARVVAGALLLLAALLHFGITVPAREGTAAAQEEFRRLRSERQRLRLRRADLERQQAAAERAARLVAASATGSGDEVTRLRQFVVDSLRGQGVRDVRLSVGAGRAPVAATVRLAAGGGFADVLRLSGHLVRPGSGIVLERVRLAGSGSAMAVEVDGVRLVR